MKCNLMAWLRKENEDISAFPIGAPFRPKEEIKPVEVIPNLPSQKKMEEVKPEDICSKNYVVMQYGNTNYWVTNIGLNDLYVHGFTVRPGETIDLTSKPEHNKIYEIKPEPKPQSEWRTGKPEKDGVYEVRSGSKIYFSHFYNGHWHFLVKEREHALHNPFITTNQDRLWKPIEE